MDEEAAKMEIPLLYTGTATLKTKADGVGNYAISIKRPGTYFVIIQSANRSRTLSRTYLLGNIYIEKVKLDTNEDKNVSTNMEL